MVKNLDENNLLNQPSNRKVESKNKKILKIGTDCSGTDAPIIALRKLNIPFYHEFSSEIDENCIKTIHANCKPKIIFKDLKKRKKKQIPDIDLYICGFPCQSFSNAGKRTGFNSENGSIFFECYKLIKYKKPKYFILENVKGLLYIDHGKSFETILHMLKKLNIYNVYWKLLNTKDYSIPQNRERLYIIGINKSCNISFDWPKKKKMQSLDKYVDWCDTSKNKLTKRFKDHLKKINSNAFFVDLSFHNFNYPNAHLYSPSLINVGTLFNVRLMRKANVKEFLKLQGFPSNYKQVVSDSNMKKQLGNSMSINVLVAIFDSLKLK